MAKILLDYSDGMYSTQPLNDEEAAKLEAQGTDVAHVEDRVLAAWQRHCDDDSAWQALWRAIANAQYLQHRERALLPLEEASREIDRLKEALASSERTKDYFANEWLRATHENNGAYTCIYPQPDCDITTLESEAWRDAAIAILAKYNRKLGEEGCRRQGCCCGHTHFRIGPEKAAQLRAAGFLVENDSEDPACDD